MHDVRTRWHDFMDAVRERRVAMHIGKQTIKHHSFFPTFELKRLDSLLESCQNLPSYFFTREAADMIPEESVTQTIYALQKFNLDVLPYRIHSYHE